MINSDFLFNRILQNVGLDTLHNSLIKDKTDFVILVKPTESNHTELYGFANEELHEGLPTSLPEIQTSEENITDIINELRVISKDLLETIETPFINTTDIVTTGAAVEAVSTTVPSNVTETPDTITIEMTTYAITSTTEDTKEHVTSLFSSNSSTESTPTTQTELEQINQIYTTEPMQTSSSDNITESATISQNDYETTFVPDYDVEGSVVVGEIIGVESIDEISGDGKLFKEPTVDILPRKDFFFVKQPVNTDVSKNFDMKIFYKVLALAHTSQIMSISTFLDQDQLKN